MSAALDFEPVDCDPTMFDRKRQQDIGIVMRLALIVASKSKQDLCGLWKAEPEATMHMMEDFDSFPDQLTAMAGLLRSSYARLMIAAHEAYGIPYSDEPAEPAAAK